MEVKMEKISRIVRGNSRVASTDLKSAAAVRPGMPSFGRPVGESTSAMSSSTTTAAKAVALHNEMLDRKKSGGDQVVQQMADQFFMTRIARPEEQMGDVQQPQPVAAAPIEPNESVEEVAEQPKGYKPRGSFVDVRA